MTIASLLDQPNDLEKPEAALQSLAPEPRLPDKTRVLVVGVGGIGNLLTSTLSQASLLSIANPDDLVLASPQIGLQDAIAAGWQVTPPLAPKAHLRAEVEAALKIVGRWSISPSATATLLGYDDPSQMAHLYSGHFGLGGRDKQDRVRLLLDIYEAVHNLFRTADNERKFLHIKQERLSGESVLDLMSEGSMLNLIKARDFVNFYSGRT